MTLPSGEKISPDGQTWSFSMFRWSAKLSFGHIMLLKLNLQSRHWQADHYWLVPLLIGLFSIHPADAHLDWALDSLQGRSVPHCHVAQAVREQILWSGATGGEHHCHIIATQWWRKWNFCCPVSALQMLKKLDLQRRAHKHKATQSFTNWSWSTQTY